MTYIFYGLASLGLLVSFFKSKEKTKQVLLTAWKSFEAILPDFIWVILTIGIALSLFTPAQISYVLGSESGFFGVLIAASIGSITLIPSFVAYPLAAALLANGAGYMQITAFVSTLMMVGIVTLPLEMKVFGKKATILRNVFAFVFALISAVIVGRVLS